MCVIDSERICARNRRNDTKNIHVIFFFVFFAYFAGKMI
jgi:hypothetical protein